MTAFCGPHSLLCFDRKRVVSEIAIIMVQRCCVAVCKKKQRRGENISFHSFPQKDNMRRAWLAAVKLTEHNLARNKDLRVCSQHFHPSDYIFGSNVRKLKTAAIPSVHLDLSNKENCSVEDVMEMGDVSTNGKQSVNAVQNDEELLTVKNVNKQFIEEITMLRSDIVVKANRIDSLESQVLTLQNEMEYLKKENERLKEQQHMRKGPPFNIKRFERNNKKDYITLVLKIMH